MEDEVNDFLAHFGVKGMKWGVRREESSSGGGRSSSTTKAEKLAQKTAKNKAQAVKYTTAAAASARTVKELDALGIKSPEMRRLYGKAVDRSDFLFKVTYGTSKTGAVAKARADATRAQTRHEKDAKNVAAGGLSRNQKLAIAGGITAVGLIAAVAIVKYPDVVTRNALPGQKISVNNFMARYLKRSANFSDKSKGLTKEAFNLLDDTDTKVPAGTVFKRLTSDPNEPLTKRLYTTFIDADNDKYAGLYGPVLQSRTRINKLHISELTMKTEISSPSNKKRVQILLDMAKESGDKAFDVGEGQTMTLREYIELISADTSSLSALMNQPDTSKTPLEDLALKAYNGFSTQLVNDNGITREYFDRVKRAGYNAVIDDNDRGQLSELPMILLDAANTTESRKNIPLTKNIERAARKRLTELLDPQYTEE